MMWMSPGLVGAARGIMENTDGPGLGPEQPEESRADGPDTQKVEGRQMPKTQISFGGTTHRITVVALAAAMAFALLAFVIAPPAQAHIREGSVDCYGWSVSLSLYDAGAENSVEIWEDGVKITDIADFGTDYADTGSWNPTEGHSLRVRVIAHNDPDGSNGASFDETWTSESCETSPTLKLAKVVDGGPAVADDWTLSASAASPNNARNFSNAGGSGSFSTIFGGVDYGLSESGGPDDYTAGSWSCSVNEGAPSSGSTINLSNGQSAVCTITNVFTPPDPSIDIVKTATPEFYGADGIGTFTITVHNNGPVPLTDVEVTDDRAIAVDPSSTCARPVKDLAVDERISFTCTIANLDHDGRQIFENEATAIGTGPYDKQVTDTDTALVYPILDTTVTTAAPTTTQAPATTQVPATTSAPSETLPVTGVANDQLRGFGFAGLALVLAGTMILGGATLVGQYRKES